MIIKTFTVVFPSLVRGKYQDQVLNDLVGRYGDNVEYDTTGYFFDLEPNYQLPAWVITGINCEVSATHILNELQQYFIDHKYSFQFSDEDLAIIIDYK